MVSTGRTRTLAMMTCVALLAHVPAWAGDGAEGAVASTATSASAASASSAASGATLAAGLAAGAADPIAGAFDDLARTAGGIASRIVGSVKAVLSPAPRADAFRRGMSLVDWRQTEFAPDAMARTISALQAAGVDSVAVIVTAYQQDETATSFEPATVPAEAVLIQVLEALRSAGLKVMLKPHVDTRHGAWRGAIQPSSWSAWFAAYDAYILRMADLAREHGVEIVSVGTELESATRNALPWLHLIDLVRARFSGKLTYASNWDEFQRIGFWAKLDFIGVDAYFPLATSDGENPSGFDRAWSVWAKLIGVESKLAGRPVLLTEVGYRPQSFGARAPFDGSLKGPIDPGVQAGAYAAARKALEGQRWLAGVYPWGWGDPDPTGYAPANSDALRILSGWYRGVPAGAAD